MFKYTEENMRYIIAIILLLASGCAVGPLVVHESARTAGEGNHEILVGSGTHVFNGKWNYGLKENLDIGLQIEAFSVGGKLKYAFINNLERGFSLAGAIGLGESLGGEHYYSDLSASYLTKIFEPYIAARIVRVKTDLVEFKDTNTGEIDFKIDGRWYTYGQGFLGTRI